MAPRVVPSKSSTRKRCASRKLPQYFGERTTSIRAAQRQDALFPSRRLSCRLSRPEGFDTGVTAGLPTAGRDGGIFCMVGIVCPSLVCVDPCPICCSFSSLEIKDANSGCYLFCVAPSSGLPQMMKMLALRLAELVWRQVLRLWHLLQLGNRLPFLTRSPVTFCIGGTTCPSWICVRPPPWVC